MHLLGNIIHAAYQILKRHGGNDDVTFHLVLYPVRNVGKTGHMLIAVLMDTHNLRIHQDGSAEFLNFICRDIP